MTADSPYKTLGTIRDAIIKDAKETTSSNMVTLINRWVNEGHEQVILRKKRDWLDQQFTVQVQAAVQETCSVTNGSATVTFSGSNVFPTGVETQFYVNGFQEVYNVSATSSATQIVTLSNPFLGETNTAASGVVFQSSIMVDNDIRTVYQTYHQQTSEPLTDIGPQQMRYLQEANGPALDYARYVTLFGQNASGSRRMVIYPYPLVAYTIYMDANTFVPVLSATADEPAIPMQYRQILYWYGMYKLFTFQRNDAQAQGALQNFNSMLHRIDGEIRGEIEFPQIVPRYSRRRSLRLYAKPFDPRLRDS